MRYNLRRARDLTTHHLPLLGVALGLALIYSGLTNPTRHARLTPADVPSPWLLLPGLALLLAITVLAVYHQFPQCRYCVSRHPDTPRPGQVAPRLLAWAHTASAHWGSIPILAAWALTTTAVLLLPTGTATLALGVAVCALCALGVVHRRLRAWCPRCRAQHPHSLTQYFRVSAANLRTFVDAHHDCQTLVGCRTETCTRDHAPTNGRTAAVWLARHLDAAHPATATVALAAQCGSRDHHAALQEATHWPE